MTEFKLVPRDVLAGLVKEIEHKTCDHSDTYRGGNIWTICQSCGKEWADDNGGKPEFEWPECVESARTILAAPQQAVEPVAWISIVQCVGPDYGKELYRKLPVQSLQPGYYRYVPLYAGHPPAQPDPWAPNRFEYDRSIHSNPDAKAWADLFVQTFPGLADKHGLMVTWFANAMMAMHDHLQRKPAQPEQPAPIPTSERLPTGADADHDGLVLAFTKFTKEWVLQSRLHVHDNPGAYTHWQPTGLTRPAAPGG